MKSTLLLTVTTATLLAASSALAGGDRCPRNHNCPGAEEVEEVICPDSDRAPQVEEVVLQDGEEMAPEGDRLRGGERGERGERGQRGERGDRQRGNPTQGLLRGIELSEDQRAQVRELVQTNQEAGREIMMAAREAQQNGDEIDREAIRGQMQELQEGLVADIRGLLDEEQAAAFDANAEARQARGGQGRNPLLRGIELDEDQQAQVAELMQANGEASRAVMTAAREARENGEEVDREAIGAELQALRDQVSDDIRGLLNEEQAAKFDENQAALAERMEGQRGQGRGEGRGQGRGQGGDADRPGRGRGGDRQRQRDGEGQLDLG